MESATKHGRYGDCRVTALLRRKSWQVNQIGIERLWRQEGLKAPHEQPKKLRLWSENGLPLGVLVQLQYDCEF